MDKYLLHLWYVPGERLEHFRSVKETVPRGLSAPFIQPTSWGSSSTALGTELDTGGLPRGGDPADVQRVPRVAFAASRLRADRASSRRHPSGSGTLFPEKVWPELAAAARGCPCVPSGHCDPGRRACSSSPKPQRSSKRWRPAAGAVSDPGTSRPPSPLSRGPACPGGEHTPFPALRSSPRSGARASRTVPEARPLLSPRAQSPGVRVRAQNSWEPCWRPVGAWWPRARPAERDRRWSSQSRTPSGDHCGRRGT